MHRVGTCVVDDAPVERAKAMTWRPVPEWETGQPMQCTVCDIILQGRELGYIPIMCEREGCPGPGERQTVTVTPVCDESSRRP